MNTCDICGTDMEETNNCEVCHSAFCNDCGNHRSGKCTRCIEGDDSAFVSSKEDETEELGWSSDDNY